MEHVRNPARRAAWIACAAAALVLATGCEQLQQEFEPDYGEIIHGPALEIGLGTLSMHAFTPDESLLVVGGAYGIHLLDGEDHEPIWSAPISGTKVTCVGISADGALVLAGSEDGNLWVWDAEALDVLHAIEAHERTVRGAAFSPDGSRAVTASDDGSAKVWDVATGDLIHQLPGHGHAVVAAEFSPDGETILTAAGDRAARLWDATTGEAIRTFEGHLGSLRTAVFSSDGSRIATASTDETARLWDAGTGELLHTLTGHGEWLTKAVFSPDGTRLLTLDDRGSIRLWDVATGGETLHIHDGIDEELWMLESRSFSSAQFSTDGSEIITVIRDPAYTLLRYDAHTGEQIAQERVGNAGIPWVAFSPDGESLLVPQRDEASLLDSRTGEVLRTFEDVSGGVAAFSPDGSLALIGGSAGLRLVNVAGGGLIRVFGTEDTLFRTATFSPDGSRILGGESGRGGHLTEGGGWNTEVHLWDAESGELLATFPVEGDSVTSLAFAEGGAHVVAVCSGKNVYTWDAATGELLNQFEIETMMLLAAGLSADGSRVLSSRMRVDYLAGAGYVLAEIHDTATGRRISSVRQHHGTFEGAALSPDGSLAATAGRFDGIRVWEANTGRTIRTHCCLPGMVMAMAFSPDATRIATGGIDGVLRIWEVPGGE